MTRLFEHLSAVKKWMNPQFIFFLCVLFFFLVNVLAAQSKISSAILKQDTTDVHFSPDDTLLLETAAVDYKQAKSGNLAMLLSAVVPGAGQLYAHRYYTIPLIWGFGIYFGSQAIKANDLYIDYRDKYAESVRLDTINHTGNNSFIDIRDFYRNRRDEFLFYLAITYILNIVDAYVGATLYDFDVSDDLGGSAIVRFRIPLH